MNSKPLVRFESFSALDLRIGKILEVREGRTRKRTYVLSVDFGAEIGMKTSCGAFTAYPADALVGRLVVGVVNLPLKPMGPETSEVLILGVPDRDGNTVFLTSEREAPIGSGVF